MIAAQLNELGVISQQPQTSQMQSGVGIDGQLGNLNITTTSGCYNQQSSSNMIHTEMAPQPPRINRQLSGIIVQSSASGKPAAMLPSPACNNHHQVSIMNPLDPLDSTDSDSEPDEPNDRARNDGTLLASDPPKPL